MNTALKCFVGALAALVVGAVHAQSTTCLVLGNKASRVSSSEGERSPVFVAKECQSLRLVSGAAQASWIGRDGKPKVLPITNQGIAGAPAPGAEERSVNVVWSELTTKREKQQPAYMRSFGAERVPSVFVPRQGLVLVERADSPGVLRISAPDGATAGQATARAFDAGQSVMLQRGDVQPGTSYTVQIQRGDLIEEWKWRMATAQEAFHVDEQLQEIERVIAVPAQRAVLTAMLFEQLRLRVNMDLLVQELRATESGQR